MLPHLFEPLLIPGHPDPVEIFPQLNPVLSFRLEALEFVTGIFITKTAKINSFLSGTGKHPAIRAIGQPFGGPASVASGLFFGNFERFCQFFQPCRIFVRGNIN